MSCECFVPRRFQAKTEALIDQINEVIAEYRAQGFALTVRQLYYQLVARVIIPENTLRAYKNVVSVVNDARLAGLIDWDAIEDRTRSLRAPSVWDSPESIIHAVQNSYQEDLWAGQECRVEVWIEKDALLGVIEGVCEDLRVPYFACRGNNSQSEQYKAGAQRFRQYLRDGLRPVVLHLGDHDPNGIDMTRDNRERLNMFAGDEGEVEVRRIALNMDQVKRYKPPPNFAKESDSRYEAYVRQFGPECWELDALEPAVIADLIRQETESLLDTDAWNEAMAGEQRNRQTLDALTANWAKVEKYIKKNFA